MLTIGRAVLAAVVPVAVADATADLVVIDGPPLLEVAAGVPATCAVLCLV